MRLGRGGWDDGPRGDWEAEETARAARIAARAAAKSAVGPRHSAGRVIAGAILRRVLMWGGLLTLLGAALIALAGVAPLHIAAIEMENGPRHLVIQGMVHLAEPQFYDRVAAEVGDRAGKGWRLYLEGVTMRNPAEAARLAAIIGEPPAFRTDIAAVLGLAQQDNARFGRLDRHPVVADVDSGELLRLFADAHIGPDPDQAPSDALDTALAQAAAWKAALPPALAPVGQFALRFAGRALMRYEFLLPVADPRQTAFLAVLVDGRSRAAARFIAQSKDQNVQVLYGELHIDGIAAELIHLDPHWTITKRTTARAF